MSREEESSESESGEGEARERDERDGGEEVVEDEGAEEKGRDRTMEARIGIPSGEGKFELSVRYDLRTSTLRFESRKCRRETKAYLLTGYLLKRSLSIQRSFHRVPTSLPIPPDS